MGDLSDLKPGDKLKCYCKVAGRNIPIRKWYRNFGDRKDIGNPEVYVLVCDSPSREASVPIGDPLSLKRSARKKVDVSCGYDRFCPLLENAWMSEDDTDDEKPLYSEKEEKLEKLEEPKKQEEPEIPENMNYREAAVESPAQHRVADSTKEAGHILGDREREKKMSGLRLEIGTIVADTNFPLDAEKRIWQARQALDRKDYFGMKQLLDVARVYAGSDTKQEQMDKIAAALEDLYDLHHNPRSHKTIND